MKGAKNENEKNTKRNPVRASGDSGCGLVGHSPLFPGKTQNSFAPAEGWNSIHQYRCPNASTLGPRLGAEIGESGVVAIARGHAFAGRYGLCQHRLFSRW